MKNPYKVSWHIRQYVKQELMDYTKNRKLIASINGNTRALLLAERRLSQIEKVIENLNQEDREACEIIFFKQYTQVGAEVSKGLSKNAYYNAMNKIIFLVAKEMDLV